LTYVWRICLCCCFGQIVLENGEINSKPPARFRLFVHKKYTTFSSIRIVALWSVDKIFPESYDFAARVLFPVTSAFTRDLGYCGYI
jgi:hypothetical protein